MATRTELLTAIAALQAKLAKTGIGIAPRPSASSPDSGRDSSVAEEALKSLKADAAALYTTGYHVGSLSPSKAETMTVVTAVTATLV